MSPIPYEMLSDVEIHSLNFVPRVDLFAIPALVLAIALAMTSWGSALRLRHYLAATALALLLAVALCFYPALVLGGHIGRRSIGTVMQHVEFAAFILAVLLILAAAGRILARKEEIKRRIQGKNAGIV